MKYKLLITTAFSFTLIFKPVTVNAMNQDEDSFPEKAGPSILEKLPREMCLNILLNTDISFGKWLRTSQSSRKIAISALPDWFAHHTKHMKTNEECLDFLKNVLNQDYALGILLIRQGALNDMKKDCKTILPKNSQALLVENFNHRWEERKKYRRSNPTKANNKLDQIIFAAEEMDLAIRDTAQLCAEVAQTVIGSQKERLISKANKLFTKSLLTEKLDQNALDWWLKIQPRNKELDLSKSPRITHLSLPSLPKNHSAIFPNLKRLSVSQCTNLTEIKINAENLNEINLKGTKVTDKVVLQLIKENRNLKDINLEECPNISFRCMNKLLLPSLTHMNLESLQMNDEAIKVFFEALSIVNKPLLTLNLKDNSISPKGGEFIAGYLIENDTLEELNLSGNKLGNAGSISIVKSLKKNTKLTKFDLSYNAIDEAGAQKLGNILKKNKNQSIEKLSLAGNNIGDQGIKSLLQGLYKITELDISNNKITHIGTNYISEFLEANPTPYLQSFSLEGNNIRDNGLISLSRVLATNQTLTSLNVKNTQFGNSGLIELGKAFIHSPLKKHYCGITHLDLSNNFYSFEGVRNFIDSFKRNPQPNFLTIEMWRLNVNKEESQKIKQAFQDLSQEMQAKKITFNITFDQH